MVKAKRGEGAKAKLKAYFMAHAGQVLDSDELRWIADSSEWARRVRELRGEHGMNIVTHNDRSDLKPGQYLLVDDKSLLAFERGISKETRAIVLDRNGYTCQMCGAVPGKFIPAIPDVRLVSTLDILLISRWEATTNRQI